jgi:hypothetical protein
MLCAASIDILIFVLSCKIEISDSRFKYGMEVCKWTLAGTKINEDIMSSGNECSK